MKLLPCNVFNFSEGHISLTDVIVNAFICLIRPSDSTLFDCDPVNILINDLCLDTLAMKRLP